MIKAKSILFFLFFLLASTMTSRDSLVVGLVSAPPFIEIQENGEIQGINIWLWEQIAEDNDLPFEYKIIPFAQMFGALADSSIDICINPLTLTAERSQIIDFTVPNYVAHTTVVVKSSSKWQELRAFLRSFFSFRFFSVVGLLFFTLLVVGFMVWLLERAVNPDQFEPGWRGLLSGIWWSAVTMTTVGYGDKAPQSLGGRILGVVWMFTAIIIISGFTGSIASSLTVNSTAGRSSSLYNFKDHAVATIRGSSTEDFLKTRFFSQRITYTSLDACFAALAKDEVEAIIYDEPILRRWITRNQAKSQYDILPLRFDPQFYAFGLRKTDHTLTDSISQSILKTKESADWEVVLSEYGMSKE